MNVLEMESESLIGSGNRRKAISANKQQQQKSGILACLLQNDFLTKVIIAAGLVLLGLMYVSTNDGTGNDSVSETAMKTPRPVQITPGPIESPTPVEDKGPSPTKAPTKAPVQAPTKAPVQPPTEPPHEPLAEMQAGPKHYEDGEYKYSNYAVVQPLVDHPLLDADNADDQKQKESILERYGKWGFWDGEEDMRPTDDYLADYPYRDMPGDDFLDEAWQADATFVNHYVNDADKLISRTMEAIFTEYGHGKPLEPEGMAERMKMFHWELVDLSAVNKAPEKYGKKGDRGNGGWTTERSQDGLVRRLLHAMMTSDTFTVVMGGHSAAAAQGNHFRQSYMMQFHKIMEPVFARLGVKLITRNVGQGGLGTLQAGMGSGSIYGDEVDLLLWDSGMTESDAAHVDLFYRQAILAGNRVPLIWGGPFELLKMLHEQADVDVGDWGFATDGIMEVESVEQAKEIPYAARYMKCKDEVKTLCQEEPRFCASCWIDREDGVKPDQQQLGKPKGQVKWHPGWRSHQLTGRNLAFAVLEGLQAAINLWGDSVMGGPPLDDDFWHVGPYYENIKKKVRDLDKKKGACYKLEGSLPARMCNTPMKARTHYTPRANPELTGINTIIKATDDGYIPKNEKKALYEGEDVHNICYDIPEDEVDVFNVAANRRHLETQEEWQPQQPNLSSTVTEEESHASMVIHTSRELKTDIVPGKGWEIFGEPQGYCDGTYNAVCSLSTDHECVLYGHHDERGAVVGTEYSGWLVLQLEDVEEGIIVLKLHSWHWESENPRTKGWTSLNNESKDRQLRSEPTFLEGNGEEETTRRELTRKYDTPELPESFKFEYAIDGKVTTLSKKDFLEQKQQLQRVVETLTILDDPNFTKEKKNVEVAIRLLGCGRECVFGLSHIYWA